MTCRSGVQAVQRIHYDVNGGIETERGRRCFEIVIDCFRDTDAVYPCFLQLLRSH